MKTHLLLCATLVVLTSLVLAGCGGDDATSRRVRLATTTSTDNSGLLDDLLPAFTEKTGIGVDVISVGTGKALEHGRRGDADLILVHARQREDAFVENGFGVDRRDVMWNDFVIVGPADDPAGVRGMKDAAAALQKIAAAEVRFISRGDDSGTHTRERGLWEKAGGRPEWEDYWEAGDGMGPCLTMAGEKQGYLLTDRGTWLSYRTKIPLAVLVEGDEALHNPYGAILVNPERHEGLNSKGAKALLDYLTSPEGQARIGAFRAHGEILFHPSAHP